MVPHFQFRTGHQVAVTSPSGRKVLLLFHVFSNVCALHLHTPPPSTPGSFGCLEARAPSPGRAPPACHCGSGGFFWCGRAISPLSPSGKRDTGQIIASTVTFLVTSPLPQGQGRHDREGEGGRQREFSSFYISSCWIPSPRLWVSCHSS